MKKYLFLLYILLASCARDNITELYSPDRRLKLIFEQDTNRLSYSLFVDDTLFVQNSQLGLEAREVDLLSNLEIEEVDHNAIQEKWNQRWGENKSIDNQYHEMIIKLSNKADVTLKLYFRLFDDGVGFRYSYTVTGCDSLNILNELTEFNIVRDGKSWSIPANSDTYELLYVTQPLSNIKTANTPITFQVGDSLYASIHEAALTDYPEMTLVNIGKCKFKSELASWPDGIKAKFAEGRFITPWRTIQLGKKAVDLINSNLILNLNEPCRIDSVDWIQPMKYIGIWWSMHLGLETWSMDDRHGATTENAKRYIDFAKKNNIKGVLFEGWNKGWESWGGMQSFDFTIPYEDFDIHEIVDYAKKHEIELIGHHETGGNIVNYERQLDNAFRWYSDLGIRYVKTGYAGGFPGGHSHHGQFAVRHYRKVVETAARYGIMLDVHEPIKDTGIRRTYPNMMTREGARGMEWNAWSEGNPPEHYELLPFTRLLGGPMDYTPGIFDILLKKSRNAPQRKKWNDLDQGNSRINTTLAKQIANWIILYSPLQMASDMIENYEGHPAFRFFQDLNIDCDWSKALLGEPGKFIVVVRRSKDTFYLGATTNEEARELMIPLTFLKPTKKYKAVIYADAEDSDWKNNPTTYRIDEQLVTNQSILPVCMARGGGQAIIFSELRE